ncbi:hypothetical protein IFM89_000070 [Coptis chinensis]|uniref:MATH domain-containing protein n=1 Tax=Coptis chinensis TaxID=261450 RepID=A0A835IHY4_9MAGN|nr:hypothetical protein IFM89_000070 [Coptis chinensis]
MFCCASNSANKLKSSALNISSLRDDPKRLGSRLLPGRCKSKPKKGKAKAQKSKTAITNGRPKRLARRVKYMPMQRKKIRGAKKRKQGKSRNQQCNKSKKGMCWSKGRRTHVYYSYWRNGLRTQHQFSAKHPDWGFWNFIPLSELRDPDREFLLDDTSILEVEVKVMKFFDGGPTIYDLLIVLSLCYTLKIDGPADPPDPSKIREEDIIGVTVLLLPCSYLGQEFIRVGYYVNNDYDDEQVERRTSPKVLIDRIQRNILVTSHDSDKVPYQFPSRNQ